MSTRIVFVNMFEAQGCSRDRGPLEVRPSESDPERSVVGVINPERRIFKSPDVSELAELIPAAVEHAMTAVRDLGEFDEIVFAGPQFGNDGCSGGAVMSFAVAFAVALCREGYSDKIRVGSSSAQYVPGGCIVAPGFRTGAIPHGFLGC